MSPASSRPKTPGGQDTRGPEEDIPRQQAPREDQYAAPGQGQQVPGQGQQVPGQGQQVPGQDQQVPGQNNAAWAASRGRNNAYPAAGGPGGYYPGGARPVGYLDGAPVGFGLRPSAVRSATSSPTGAGPPGRRSGGSPCSRSSPTWW